MFVHNIDPILFQIGPLAVRYYGLFYAMGFVIAYFMLPWLAKRKNISLTKDQAADLVFYSLIGVVAGARIVYVIVYNFSFFLSNPLEIFALWHGGLSFHGALIGGIFAGWLYCRKQGLDFLAIADLAIIPASLGLVFGRIANFINGELVGRVTDVAWCVVFPGVEGCRHPSQLYESLKNLFIFSVLWSVKGKPYKKGTFLAIFAILYSSLRFFIEFVREPDVQLGFIFGLTMGQWLNILMFGISLFFFYRINAAKSDGPSGQ